MATISNVTTANSIVSGATLDVTGITAAVGDFLVLACAADNAGTAGVSSTSTTITDAAGNTWTSQAQTNYSPGNVISDGTHLGLWTCPVTSALSSATITLNFSPNTTSKTATLKKAVPAAGKSIFFHSVGAGATGTGTAWNAPTAVAVPINSTIFGYISSESTGPATIDSDTTNGSWSADQTASANTGAQATSQCIAGQHKTVTATGDQDYGRTAGASRDWAANWLIISEVTSGTLAATGAQDAAALTGVLEMYGTLAATETADAAAFTASHGWTSTLAATEAADVAALFGALELYGALAATGAPDTAIFLGVDGPVGFLAATERPDRAAFSMAPGWPTMLPIPTLQGYSFRPDSAVERRPMEIGAPRVYRRTRRPPIEVAVAFQVNEAQQELLDGFQTSTLQQGQNWFGINLAFPSGFSLAAARFKDKVAYRAMGGPRWQTTATLELLTRPVMSDAALTVLLDDAGDPPAWPTTLLPYPTLDGWELTPKPVTARTEDLPGFPQARQRSFNSTTEVPAAWELSATQAAIFDAFFVHRGKEGAAWFDFPLKQAIGIVTTKVRFLGEADWTPRNGNGRWAVSAPLEIRERRVLTAAEVSAQIASW